MANTRLMTSGSPVKQIFIFALPIMISGAVANLYNLADSTIVGNLISSDALAAVSSTSGIFGLCSMLANGLTAGMSVIISQKYGENNYSDLKKAFANGLEIIILISALITVFGAVFTRSLLTLMNTPENILSDACTYLRIIFLGSATLFVYSFIAASLRAVGDSLPALIYQIIGCVLNIGSDFLFIKVFHMGVDGAALATVLTQLLSLILGIIHIKRKIDLFHFSKYDLYPEKYIIRGFLRIGLPTCFISAMNSLGTIACQIASNSLGSNYVAAVACAGTINSFVTTIPTNHRIAYGTYAAQNFGAKNLARIKQGLKSCMIFEAAFCIVAAVIFLFAGRSILSFMSGGNQTVIEEGNKVLLFWLPLNSLWLVFNLQTQTLNSCGRPFIPTVCGLMESVVRIIVILIFLPTMGFFGVILTHPVTWLTIFIFVQITYPIIMKKIKTEIIKKDEAA